MSASLLSAFAAAGTLFGGFGKVTLGPVLLDSIEVPERIQFGGEQQLIVHKLPGGGRIVNAMGRDDMPLTWSGYLEGQAANSRAMLLDGLRQSGQQITLAWSIYSFTVVVQHFVATYTRDIWIPYEISCVVVRDNAAKFSNPVSSLLDSLGDDINSTAGFDLTGSVAQGVTAAQTALQAVGATSLGSSAYAGASLALGSAQSLIQGGIAASNGTIAGVIAGGASAAGILGTADPNVAVAQLGSVALAAGSLANLTAAGGYVARAQTNLANAGA